MSAITEAYVNNYVHRTAEEMRAMKVKLDAMVAAWAVVRVADNVPNDSTVVDDSRLDEGIPAITGAELYNQIVGINALLTAINTGNTYLNLTKFCVRELTAS